MKVTRARAIETFNAIALLPAIPSGKAAYALARTRSKLRPIQEAFEEANKNLFKKHFGEVEEVKRDHPNWAKYRTEQEQILQETEEIDPHMFSEEDLNLNELKEPVHPSVLEALFWLMTTPQKNGEPEQGSPPKA